MFDEFLGKYRFSTEKAQAKNLPFDKGKCIVRCALEEEGFYAIFEIDPEENAVDVGVFEEPDGEEYLPFLVSSSQGAFTSMIKEQVQTAFENNLGDLFELVDAKALIMGYMCERYGTVYEEPWETTPGYYTFKTEKKKKWYALVGYIGYDKLGIEEKEGLCDFMNIKAVPSEIPSIVDNEHFFPAYHMNKTHWLTVLLDQDLDIEKTKRLIDESYALVEK